MPSRGACASRPGQHPSPRLGPGASPPTRAQLPRSFRPPWERKDTVNGSAWWALKERKGGRQLEASGVTAVSRRGLLLGRSPSLLWARPREGRAGSPQGVSQAGLVPSTAFARSPFAPLPVRGRSAGLWVRGQPGRESGMKDDSLNNISVRGLSGLMS